MSTITKVGNLIVTGECSTQAPPWGNLEYTPPACPLGTLGCWTKHGVRCEGSHCKRCHGPGGSYTCPESDRIAFTCSNYQGHWRG